MYRIFYWDDFVILWDRFIVGSSGPYPGTILLKSNSASIGVKSNNIVRFLRRAEGDTPQCALFWGK